MKQKSKFNKKYIRKILKFYDQIYPTEKILENTQEWLQKSKNPVSRKNFLGHITTSAIVLNPNLTEVLMIKHKILDKDFQPGGHMEESDISFTESAKRELIEETGFYNVNYIPITSLDPNIPIDIDIHEIPENVQKQEPKHKHIDFRYLFILNNFEGGNANTKEIKCFFWKELNKFSTDESDLYRAINKATKLIQLHH